MSKGTEITIEGGDGNAVHPRYWGKSATVIKVLRTHAIVDAGDNVFGVLRDYCQPKVTAASLAARFATAC
jgi:hypothetical protein